MASARALPYRLCILSPADVCGILPAEQADKYEYRVALAYSVFFFFLRFNLPFLPSTRIYWLPCAQTRNWSELWRSSTLSLPCGPLPKCDKPQLPLINYNPVVMLEPIGLFSYLSARLYSIMKNNGRLRLTGVSQANVAAPARVDSLH
jgi:hypothetical protein